MKLSAIIIAKNESEVIENALKSLKFCDEIIVIDNNSSDDTSEISKRVGAVVYKSESSSFSELRDFGKEKAKGDFILYVDADEVVSNELENSIKSVMNSGIFSNAYRIKRKNYYLGKNEWPGYEKMERLFLKSSLIKWTGNLHESPMVNGSVSDLDGYLLHFTHRNLNQMLRKTIDWSDIEAKIRFDANHPKMSWWRFPRVMISTFISYYIKQQGYKLGAIGLIESIYQSFSIFLTYSKLWELQNKSR